MSLARNTLVQSSLTLGSRLLGFARDMALAAQFGQGPLMDIWATAILVPNIFRRLFAEGAFAQAFVPVYGRIRSEDGEAAAAQAAAQTLSFLLFVVAAFCVAAQIAMPWIMPLLLSYMHDPQTLKLAVVATQLAMPYLACMSVAALLSGVLNTSGRFVLSAGVPVLLNICTLAALAVPWWEDEQALLFTSAAVTLSGVLQAALLWWGVERLGIRLRPAVPRLTPTVRRVLKLAVPGAVAGGALQLSSVVSQLLTGSDPGARSVLYNADRLYQLPLGLVGVAIGLALVPRLTRSFVTGDHEQGRRTLDDGIALALAFTLPAAVALLVAPYFIIDATVSRGEFTSQDAARTADVLKQFAWGVPAFVLAKVFTPPFFARQDMRRPMRFAVVTVAINVVLGSALFFGMGRAGYDGVLGLAIATSLAAWVNVLLLAGTLAREGVYRPDTAVIGRLFRIGAASAVMGVVVGGLALIYPLLADRLLSKEIAVLFACAAGGVVYAAALIGFGGVTLAELRGALRRESSGGGAAAGPGLDL